MAKPRLNDTVAITAKPLDANESHSICTRKIDNGYITRTSYYNEGTGESRSAEKFTKTAPKITPPRADGRQGASPDSPSSLRETVEYLGPKG